MAAYATLFHAENAHGERVRIASIGLDFYVAPDGDLATRGVGAVLEDVVIRVDPSRVAGGRTVQTEPVRPGRCVIRILAELPLGLRASLEKVEREHVAPGLL